MADKTFHKIYFLIVVLPVVFMFVSFNGCYFPARPPAGPSLKKLTPAQINSHNWMDDLEFEGIEQAIDKSVQFFSRVPETEDFRYGEMVYSPEEMIASLRLFRDIIINLQGEERIKQLREKFLFFESMNSEGSSFFTGYYEPVIDGSRVPTGAFPEPVYETPEDLIEADLGRFSERWKNEKITGRLKGNQLVPYDSREDIVYGRSLEDRAEVIAYVSEIELFFLQIQGSGLIRLPDGKLKRVNYAQKNGHPYNAIGEILKDRIKPEELSLQSIKAYLYANPDEVRDILGYNQSYTFFREAENGPTGNIGVTLTPERSVAMDKRMVPQGGLAYIETEFPAIENGITKGWKPVKRFVLVQDTGGAIRNHGRIDIFLGRGDEAELIAGHLKQRGRSFLVVARKEFINKGRSTGNVKENISSIN